MLSHARDGPSFGTSWVCKANSLSDAGGSGRGTFSHRSPRLPLSRPTSSSVREEKGIVKVVRCPFSFTTSVSAANDTTEPRIQGVPMSAPRTDGALIRTWSPGVSVGASSCRQTRPRQQQSSKKNQCHGGPLKANAAPDHNSTVGVCRLWQEAPCLRLTPLTFPEPSTNAPELAFTRITS